MALDHTITPSLGRHDGHARRNLVGRQRRGDRATQVVLVDDQVGVGGLRQQLGRPGAEPACPLVLSVHDDLAGEPAVARGVQRGAPLDGGVPQPGRLVVQPRPGRLGDGDLLLAGISSGV
jgi:hypothetical protein